MHFNSAFSERQRVDWAKKGGSKAVLHSEMAGLVNWLLELSQDDITTAMLVQSDYIKDANLQAQAHDNPLIDWFLQSIVPCDKGVKHRLGCRIYKTKQGEESIFDGFEYEFYPNYLQWCQRNGKKGISAKCFQNDMLAFAKSLKDCNFKADKDTKGGYIIGLKIKKEHENEQGWRLR